MERPVPYAVEKIIEVPVVVENIITKEFESAMEQEVPHCVMLSGTGIFHLMCRYLL